MTNEGMRRVLNSIETERKLNSMKAYYWMFENEEESPYRYFTPYFSAYMIKNVEFYPPATKMTFVDGTVTTSVAQEGDEFNKEVGMMVCIMKYIFKGKGYNNMFRKWIKNADKREAAKAQEIKKQEEAKAIKERQAAKEAKRRAERAERAREREIEIQKEAYVRAMREVQSDKTEGADV